MTRYARAKGSKSSNSRTPEESTNWEEMKKDFQDKVSSKKVSNGEVVEVESPSVKTQERSSVSDPQWAEFETSDSGTMQTGGKRKSIAEVEQGVEVGSKKKQKKSKQQNGKSGDTIAKAPTRTDLKSSPKHGRDTGAKHKQSTRKTHEEKTTLKVNGLLIDVVRFDNFLIKAEDAERLKDLREKLMKEGIPQEEVQKVMKLERRKAEKALAKIKKQVCFQCRKAGHALSECPQNKLSFNGPGGEDELATGLCYKCGSTEHTHFECKVQKDGEYRFAKCFICHEQGHISNQCPDNPKGLYPRGGGCNICGEVTHLKKDCPQLAKTRGEAAVTLGTIGSEWSVDDLDEESALTSIKKSIKCHKKRKFVKF